MTYLTLLAALLLSGIAAYYSVIGLASIFVGAFWPVVFMGSSLEFAKLVTTSWLYRNWKQAPFLLKLYLTIAVVILMLITSMGIFGFLSKAHLEQSAEMAPLVNKVAMYDEKIKISKENIDVNRKALKQLDEAVDQVMARSQDEKGADKAVAIRRGQAKERARLLQDIETEQKVVAKLSEDRAPLSLELSKAESDFGPIKYVADVFYGTGEDSVDKAVRLVIMLIMLVFDPLAVLLLIAANMNLKKTEEDVYKPDAWVADVGEPPTEQEKSDFEGVRSPGEDWRQTGPTYTYKTEYKEEPETPKTEHEHETEVRHIIPGMYEEHKVPVKKLEPKYDYDDPYAFREKENK